VAVLPLLRRQYSNRDENRLQNWPFSCISPNGRSILHTDPGTLPGDTMLVENF
jgi:hypothetical protein